MFKSISFSLWKGPGWGCCTAGRGYEGKGGASKMGDVCVSAERIEHWFYPLPVGTLGS